MRPSKAPGVWGSSRWLEQLYPLMNRPELRIADYPGQSDIVYDEGDRKFWEKLSVTACHAAAQNLTRILPEAQAHQYAYKPLDKEAVRQIAQWQKQSETINAMRRAGSRYCRRHHYPAEGILDRITGDQDVKLAGLDPNPTERDILDHMTFGFGLPAPGVIESIRAQSDGYSTLAFGLWQESKLRGFIAGNSTRRNYGRDHVTFELLQKGPHWGNDHGRALEMIGLPAVMAARLLGKETLMITGADDPEGLHRLLSRRSFAMRVAHNPLGYGLGGAMTAQVGDLAKHHSLTLPEPMVPQKVRFDGEGKLCIKNPAP